MKKFQVVSETKLNSKHLGDAGPIDNSDVSDNEAVVVANVPVDKGKTELKWLLLRSLFVNW